MHILDRYIIKKIVLSYLFVVFSFIGLHFIIDLFSHLKDFLEAKVSLYIILQYYIYSLPLFFLRTSSFAMPISILYSVGELNRNNEIISMRSSGISIERLALPILFFALFLSFFSLFLQENVLIYSQKKADDTIIEFVKTKSGKQRIERNLVFRSDSQLFFASEFIPQKNILKGVTILKGNTEGNIEEKIMCQTVTYKKHQWEAYEVISYKLNKYGEMIGQPILEHKRIITLTIKPKEILLKKNSLSEYIPLKKIKKEIKMLKKEPSSNLINNLIINYHKKIAEPFAHLFLTIGVLPFAFEIRKRKVALSALAGGFMFGFLYYLIFSISISLGRKDILIPYLSSWVAPLFFLAMGISGIILIR